MTPEEFYHLNKLKKLKNKDTLFEMRVKSLEWMLGCFLQGTIRRRTIINLIPENELHSLLLYMEEKERYEDCKIIKDVIDIIYKEKYIHKDMSKKRQKENIGLLENTIQKEKEKKGGGNKELIEKLEFKLEDVINKKPKK